MIKPFAKVEYPPWRSRAYTFATFYQYIPDKQHWACIGNDWQPRSDFERIKREVRLGERIEYTPVDLEAYLIWDNKIHERPDRPYSITYYGAEEFYEKFLIYLI